MPASVVIKYKATDPDGDGPFLRLLNPGEEGRGRKVLLPPGVSAQDAIALASALLSFGGIAVESNLDRDLSEEQEERIRTRARDAADKEERAARQEAREERKAAKSVAEGSTSQAGEPPVTVGNDPSELRRDQADFNPSLSAKAEGEVARSATTEVRSPVTSGGSPQTKQAGVAVPPNKVGPGTKAR